MERRNDRKKYCSKYKKNNLSSLSEKEIEQMMNSILTDEELEEDDDDSVGDPDYQWDDIRAEDDK